MQKLNELGVSPKLYDHGFCLHNDSAIKRFVDGIQKTYAPGFFWQAIERFDGSLTNYARGFDPGANPTLTELELEEVEEKLVALFMIMAQNDIFCADLKADNVVVRGGPRAPQDSPWHGKPLELKLIDMDGQFCQKTTKLNQNELFGSLLFTFSNNTIAMRPDKPFFRSKFVDWWSACGQSRAFPFETSPGAVEGKVYQYVVNQAGDTLAHYSEVYLPKHQRFTMNRALSRLTGWTFTSTELHRKTKQDGIDLMKIFVQNRDAVHALYDIINKDPFVDDDQVEEFKTFMDSYNDEELDE